MMYGVSEIVAYNLFKNLASTMYAMNRGKSFSFFSDVLGAIVDLPDELGSFFNEQPGPVDINAGQQQMPNNNNTGLATPPVNNTGPMVPNTVTPLPNMGMPGHSHYTSPVGHQMMNVTPPPNAVMSTAYPTPSLPSVSYPMSLSNPSSVSPSIPPFYQSPSQPSNHQPMIAHPPSNPMMTTPSDIPIYRVLPQYSQTPPSQYYHMGNRGMPMQANQFPSPNQSMMFSPQAGFSNPPGPGAHPGGPPGTNPPVNRPDPMQQVSSCFHR